MSAKRRYVATVACSIYFDAKDEADAKRVLGHIEDSLLTRRFGLPHRVRVEYVERSESGIDEVAR